MSLDPDNNTITSKTQAIFEFRDGGWYLTDKSEQQTTFIRASGTVKLEKGDVILMGNRKFIFDC
jgi:predicted component of type VI protein secretion system